MKAISTAVGVLICMSLILSGCQERQPFGPADGEEFAATPQPLTGGVTGSARVVYTLAEGTVVCGDEGADYQLTLAKDNHFPGDTLLTSLLPDKTQYFRLNIMAVMRILEKGKCLERDPSDDRIHMVVEGYYDGVTHQFTALTCSKTSTVSKTEIVSSNDDVVSGQIECVYSEQKKFTFSFSDLKLK